MTDFSELDAAARANLSERGVRLYEQRKREVLNDPDAALILRGWIWDQIEEENPPHDDDEL